MLTFINSLTSVWCLSIQRRGARDTGLRLKSDTEKYNGVATMRQRYNIISVNNTFIFDFGINWNALRLTQMSMRVMWFDYSYKI